MEEELSISGKDLYELMSSFFDTDPRCSMKIQCKGASMFPFIKENSIVTIAPLDKNCTLVLGDIVAAAVHSSQKVVVHRIINITSNGYHLKGDNNGSCDGWFQCQDLFGIVEEIEMPSGQKYTPKHWQNLLIAWASRTNIFALKKLLYSAKKALKNNYLSSVIQRFFSFE